MSNAEWHALDSQDVARQLGVDTSSGLSSEESTDRLISLGKNTITSRARKSYLTLFISQFSDLLVIILIVAFLITLALGDYIDASVIIAVVIVNAIIGFMQQARAENAIESLRKMMVMESSVLRDGTARRVPSEVIVPGDIILLQSGDKVPADIRLFELRNLHVDESILTGESAPLPKSVHPVAASVPISDRACMAYSGTLITSGSCKGIVVATGDDTELGKISELISETIEIATPLTRKLAGFGKWLSSAVLGIAGMTFLIGVLQGRSTQETFSAAVAIAVAMIPEGLPAILTIVLAVGVKRMANRNAIVRTLPSVETLGSVTVICSDKTGTLTANEMTVRRVCAGAEEYELGGIGYDPESGRVTTIDTNDSRLQSESFVECLRCGLLCNESQLVRKGDDWIPEGDPTEVALITAAIKVGLDPTVEKIDRAQVDIIPFESSNMYMATLNRSPQGDSVIYVKGSLERILEMCSVAMTDSQPVRIDKKHVQNRADDLANQGFRILAFARRLVPPNTDSVSDQDLHDMVLLGIQAMSDPARPEAIAAVRKCKKAGIEVKMITGDNVSTAHAIARDMGIGDEHSISVTGSQLAAMDEEQFDAATCRATVFARVSPEQKYRLVGSLQKAGEIVAMTGDGVNDAPALKRADIGVAMGKAGSDVAKDASDMVLTDDNFASIVAAVEEGRTVFSNLVKTLVYILPTNFGEGAIIVAALLSGLALPVMPVQILWTNTITAVTLALPFAFEPTEQGIMSIPPRSPGAPILSSLLVVRLLDVGLYMVLAGFAVFLYETSTGAAITESRTAAITTIVLIEAFYIFQARSERIPVWRLGLFSNPYVWIGIPAVILLQLAFVYIPTMNHFFGSSPLSGEMWLRVILASFPVTIVVALERVIRKHFASSE